MNKVLAFFFRRDDAAVHDDSLRAGVHTRNQGPVSPYIAAMLPRVD